MSGTAKFCDNMQEFMLFHFMYKVRKIVLKALSKLVLKLDTFVKLGQVMAIGGMKMRFLVKHMEQQG